jgi:hypothetical protein
MLGSAGDVTVVGSGDNSISASRQKRSEASRSVAHMPMWTRIGEVMPL